MRLRRVSTWIIVFALILGFAGIGWNLVDIRRSGSEAKSDGKVTVRTCDDLREFITAEEDISFPLWKKYHREVISYEKGLPKNERPAKVSEIAASVTEVLKSDLKIYQQMKKLPECLDSEFRKEIQEWITTTEEMIGYLKGESELDGNLFDPSEGFWDTTFYDAFYSAAENLVSGLQDI
jgi:hypothetical protein